MRTIETLLHDLPVQPLLDAIEPDMWEDIRVRQQYPGSAHRDTECIFLRGPASFLNFFDTTAQDYPRLPQLLDELMPILLPLLNLVQCEPDELGRLMLVKLKPHGWIRPHMDEGEYADTFNRQHVCLSSNEHCEFRCGPDSLRPQPGDAFRFNHRVQHTARNDGETDRIHLIVDTLAGDRHV